MHIAVVLVSALLFFVLFFGIGFILNMLLRMTWIMAFIYPLVTIAIVDNISTLDYLFQPGESFGILSGRMIGLQPVDIAILSCGFLGAIGSGFVMRLLRAKGYQMF
ncbi:YuiB family protein [Domibacillus sp. 8LH]|uniref:YuiB family protein n=1 Tax=unclassified Domibacillus TaxID=2632383 RepID=UPI0028117668|nr:YuiB family protein [Domibacillus sp.]